MKKTRTYKSLLRRNKKRLDALNKKARKSPWDWGFGLDYLIAFMEFMREYYNLGENVWQAEESLTQVRESLDKTLNAYYEWINFEYDLGDIDTYNAKYKEAREKFFKLLEENIEYWWD